MEDLKTIHLTESELADIKMQEFESAYELFYDELKRLASYCFPNSESEKQRANHYREMQEGIIKKGVVEVSKRWIEEADRMIEQAEKQRELILNGVDYTDFLMEIGKMKHINKHVDSLLRSEKEEELEALIDRLKAGMKEDRKGRMMKSWATMFNDPRTDCYIEMVSGLRAYVCANAGELASAYFELSCDNIIAGTFRAGYEKSAKKLVELKAATEHFMQGTGFTINEEYIKKKLKLLRATYDLEELRRRKKEEEKARREAIAEEKRAQREYEAERRRAEKDEALARHKLEEAQRKQEQEQADSAKWQRYQQQIAELKEALQTAIERQERAISMAQQTRRGFVYVISNVGSFGEGVYKIGLTRRLDPQERVIELGDASVPFPFDTHAMIESEDAPALEAALHRAFESRKVNRVNGRKEFFRVSLEEIAAVLKTLGIEANFEHDVRSREYTDSLFLSGSV